MDTTVKKRMINVEEFYRMGETGMIQPHERVELINGEIYTMSPRGSKHAAVVNQLSTILFRNFDPDFIISIQNPVHIGS